MKTVTAVLADKDDSSVRLLESLLTDLWSDLHICDRASDGPRALDSIRNHVPDLAFLEVRLPGICGMQVARKVVGSCRIVFVTDCDRYALNAFDSGACDYLLKPITRERLEKSVSRLKEQMGFSAVPGQPDSERAPQAVTGLTTVPPQAYLQWLCVHQGDGVLVVPVEEVCYFRSDDKYTVVVTEEGESVIRKPIKELACQLDPNRYWRIHRGIIVNVAHVEKVSRSLTGRGALRLKKRPELLTVSRPYLNLFRQM